MNKLFKSNFFSMRNLKLLSNERINRKMIFWLLRTFSINYKKKLSRICVTVHAGKSCWPTSNHQRTQTSCSGFILSYHKVALLTESKTHAAAEAADEGLGSKNWSPPHLLQWSCQLNIKAAAVSPHKRPDWIPPPQPRSPAWIQLFSGQRRRAPALCDPTLHSKTSAARSDVTVKVLLLHGS